MKTSRRSFVLLMRTLLQDTAIVYAMHQNVLRVYLFAQESGYSFSTDPIACYKWICRWQSSTFFSRKLLTINALGNTVLHSGSGFAFMTERLAVADLQYSRHLYTHLPKIG